MSELSYRRTRIQILNLPRSEAWLSWTCGPCLLAPKRHLRPSSSAAPPTQDLPTRDEVDLGRPIRTILAFSPHRPRRPRGCVRGEFASCFEPDEMVPCGRMRSRCGPSTLDGTCREGRQGVRTRMASWHPSWRDCPRRSGSS